MSPRIATWLGALILLASVLVPASIPWGQGRAEQARAAAEADSFVILGRAQSAAELREGVGHLGVMLKVRGGGWVAIRYRDSHAAPGWSSAVARDSGGAWFVSSEHFCGRFQTHRQQRERGADGAAELRAVEESERLEAAREQLIGLGFTQVPPPK